MFSDLGALATGRISGANAALCLQLTNFVLYQPVALLTSIRDAGARRAHALAQRRSSQLWDWGTERDPPLPSLLVHTSCRGSPPHPRPVVALAQP